MADILDKELGDVAGFKKDLDSLYNRSIKESNAHHLHGDVGCIFFWRRSQELKRMIEEWDKEIPKD